MTRKVKVVSRISRSLAAFLLIGTVGYPSVSAAQNYGQRSAQARSQVQGNSSRPHGGNATPHTAPAGRHPAAVGAAVAGIPVGAAGARGVHGTYPTRPRPVVASASAAGLGQALTTFQLDMGRLPTAAEGLDALLRAPAGARNWRGPYISVVSGQPPFTDPWGNLYQLVDTSKGGRSSFMIRSNGPDGIPNTADDISISG